MNTINLREYIENRGDYPIWHPYHSSNIKHFDIPSIDSGEGIYVYDSNKKCYIDLSSGLWNIALGYGNIGIENAIIEQLKKISFCSLFEYTNDTIITAANSLINIIDENMKKVIFGCSGSESIECAIKIMRNYWKIKGYKDKKDILSFSNSYHGTYYGSMGVSGLERETIKDFLPKLQRVKFINPEYEDKCKLTCNTCNSECLNKISKLVKENKNKISGIIIEPILASSGVLKPCKKYLNSLINLCKNNEVLVTIDEVATGFYRTGESFYFKKLSVVPDILCLSKGINSGYLPLGATVVNEEIAGAFSNGNFILNHGSTQGGNPISCAAMIESIKQLSEIRLNLNLIEKSSIFYSELKKSIMNISIVGDIRAEGFLFGIDIVNLDEDKIDNDIYFIKNQLKKNGLLVYHSERGITLLPMIITTYEEWSSIVKIIKKTLLEIGGN